MDNICSNKIAEKMMKNEQRILKFILHTQPRKPKQVKHIE